MKLFDRLVTRYPRAVLVIIAVITLVCGVFALRIQRQADLESNIPRSNPRLAAYLDFRENYSSGQSVVLVVSAEDIFEPGTIQNLHRLTEEVASLDGISGVTGLTTVAGFEGSEDGLKSGPVIAQLPAIPEEAEVLRRTILADPWYAGQLVSHDGRSTIIVARFADIGTFGENTAVLNRIREVARRYKDNLTVDYAGSVVMQEQIDRFLGKDLGVLFPVVLFCIVAVLFLTFRSGYGVVLPLVTVLITVVWTIGVMAIMGRPLSLISNVLPVLLVGVGSAYGIHIVARYREERIGGVNGREAVSRVIASTGFSVWLAAFTTIAGFGSLALSKMQMVFDFGVFSALGVGVAFLVSITFIPAVLTLRRTKGHAQPRTDADAGSGIKAGDAHAGSGAHAAGAHAANRTAQFLGRMVGWCTEHHTAVLIMTVVLLLGAAVGWTRLVPSFDPSDFLPRKSDHRRTEALVDARFGGSAELEILVQGDPNDPEFLRRVQKYQDEMENLGVLRPLSLADLLTKVNRAFHDNDPAYETLPDDPAIVPQYLFLLSLSGGNEDLSRFMNFDQTEIRLSSRISNVMSTGERTRLIAALEERAADIFGPDTAVQVTGAPILELTMMDVIRDEQMRNILSSLAAVLLLVVVAFRSLTAGVSCLTPIAVSIAAIFGFMGWIGIPLNTATAIIASLATGIGIDYSIHFYQRYLEERKRGFDVDAALIESARTSGSAILANALAVGAGFAILVLSALNLFRSFGGLVALAMVLTAAGSLTVLPAVIKFRTRLLGKTSLINRRLNDIR